MAAKKAQMLVVTAVFLTGLLFAVQQALLTYSLLDLSDPFQTKENYIAMNLIDSVNYTIRTQKDTTDHTADCLEFENHLKELLSVMRHDLSGQGYLVETIYMLNCSYWDNARPFPAPMELTISFTGTCESFGKIKFYHKQ